MEVNALRIYGKEDVRLESVVVSDQLQANEILIKIDWVGICGSDLSYYYKGGSGTFQIHTPLIFGHEFSGTVEQVGSEVADIKPGDKGVVCPAVLLDGYDADTRLKGRDNLTNRLEFMGSALLPTDGGFVQKKVISANQFIKVTGVVDEKLVALTEPLAVAIHAVNRITNLDLKAQILVNGAGPIGLLVLAYLKYLGATNVTVADISDFTLDIAQQLGADSCINVSESNVLNADNVYAFEASGVVAALEGVLNSMAKGSTVVQVGNLPLDKRELTLANIVTKEIGYFGAFRWTKADFLEAAHAIADGINISPIITHTFKMADYKEMFTVAASTSASKVLAEV
jgi:L-idonate 5-dehydrogenase